MLGGVPRLNICVCLRPDSWQGLFGWLWVGHAAKCTGATGRPDRLGDSAVPVDKMAHRLLRGNAVEVLRTRPQRVRFEGVHLSMNHGVKGHDIW